MAHHIRTAGILDAPQERVRLTAVHHIAFRRASGDVESSTDLAEYALTRWPEAFGVDDPLLLEVKRMLARQ